MEAFNDKIVKDELLYYFSEGDDVDMDAIMKESTKKKSKSLSGHKKMNLAKK